MKFERDRNVKVISSKEFRSTDPKIPGYINVDLTGLHGKVIGTIPPNTPDNPNRVMVRLGIDLGKKIGSDTSGDVVNFLPTDLAPVRARRKSRVALPHNK